MRIDNTRLRPRAVKDLLQKPQTTNVVASPNAQFIKADYAAASSSAKTAQMLQETFGNVVKVAGVVHKDFTDDAIKQATQDASLDKPFDDSNVKGSSIFNTQEAYRDAYYAVHDEARAIQMNSELQSTLEANNFFKDDPEGQDKLEALKASITAKYFPNEYVNARGRKVMSAGGMTGIVNAMNKADATFTQKAIEARRDSLLNSSAVILRDNIKGVILGKNAVADGDMMTTIKDSLYADLVVGADGTITKDEFDMLFIDEADKQIEELIASGNLKKAKATYEALMETKDRDIKLYDKITKSDGSEDTKWGYRGAMNAIGKKIMNAEEAYEKAQKAQAEKQADALLKEAYTINAAIEVSEDPNETVALQMKLDGLLEVAKNNKYISPSAYRMISQDATKSLQNAGAPETSNSKALIEATLDVKNLNMPIQDFINKYDGRLSQTDMKSLVNQKNNFNDSIPKEAKTQLTTNLNIAKTMVKETIRGNFSSMVDRINNDLTADGEALMYDVYIEVEDSVIQTIQDTGKAPTVREIRGLVSKLTYDIASKNPKLKESNNKLGQKMGLTIKEGDKGGNTDKPNGTNEGDGAGARKPKGSSKTGGAGLDTNTTSSYNTSAANGRFNFKANK